MAVGKTNRLSKVAKEFNVGTSTIIDFLKKKGFDNEFSPNSKISDEMYQHIQNEYSTDLKVRKDSQALSKKKQQKQTVSIKDVHHENSEDKVETKEVKIEKEVKKKDEVVKRKTEINKPKIVGKIDLNKKSTATATKDKENKETAKKEHTSDDKKNKEVSTTQVKSETKKVEKTIEMSNNNKSDKKEANENKEVKKNIKKVENKEKAELKKEVKTKESVKVKNEKSKETPEQKEEVGDDIFNPNPVKKLSGLTVVGKIDLPTKSEGNQDSNKKKRKRKRIRKDKERVNINDKANQGQNNKQKNKSGKGGDDQNKQSGQNKKGKQYPNNKSNNSKNSRKAKNKRPVKPEISEEDVQKQIKDTLARLTANKGKSKSSRYRREKRDAVSQRQQEEIAKASEEKNIIKVTEFVTVAELASMMDVQVNQIIASCMTLGLFVSINQRLDAETISLVAEEFNFKVEFISVEVAEAIEEEEFAEEMYEERPPIITVMGHVDHGKTSLLDHIRNANVIEGEAGGITQHIGAYSVKLKSGRKITFLDTPGHEAFTAMRARGAQVTDIVIIIVAADDNVMPQTVEAINHASAAGVPIVFAINKIDKPGANPDRIKEELANMNYLVEDWGGKYQSQEISAKSGLNVHELLEKVLLEADLLELKSVKNKRAVGSVIESSLDKGRGYVTTVLVQSGTLKIGDIILAGSYMGHVKAMFNERNQRVDSVGPSEPVLVLGLNGAAQAGETINVLDNEKEARDIANKRTQLQREQGMRTKKHITLEEIGRRRAIGNFQELNVIVKGDVDGSIEALSDALLKLSTEEIQVNVIHKAVGQISESDVTLAAASNAIVIGFQVRPSMMARKMAEKEEIDIRLYSIIYDAIEELKAAMEGMLSPEIKEQVIATLEIRETFKISKVGTIAGCMVKEGKIKRSSKVRLIRDGIVIYTGLLGSLKRYKDDVKEVASGYECGLNIENYNDIKEGDIVEAYEEIEVSRKL